MTTDTTPGTLSQTALILAHLQDGHALTPLDAMQAPFHCMRLGARIWNLKQAGHEIEKVTLVTKSGKRVACYRLAAREVTAV